MKTTPLAELIRPESFADMVGQPHLFGPRGTLRRMCESGRLTNMIFFGPPGTGKTTAASLVAKSSDMTFHRLNATTASLADVKAALSDSNTVFGQNGVLLYIDEIQYFNRKQQQSLLEYIEDGRVTLIASTTENPHFCLHNALISRSTLFEFKSVSPDEVARALGRALEYLNAETGRQKSAPDTLRLQIGKLTGGDVRRAVLLFENAYYNAEGDEITEGDVSVFECGICNYSDDSHYDLLSALQKSIRGSDPDATAFYLCRLLEAGELLSVCRRLRVIASEDVGLAYPIAAAVTESCCASAVALGMPEARLPLVNAAILLATAPKSNSAYSAYAAALADVEKGLGHTPPEHLQAPLYRGYKYPHEYKNHYLKQQYLPDDLRDRVYYEFGENKTEAAAKAYAEAIGSYKTKKK